MPFQRLNPCGKLWVTASAKCMPTIHPCKGIQCLALIIHLRIRFYVSNRDGPRHNPRTLMCTWEEVTGVHLRTSIRLRGCNRYERWEVTIFAPKAITDPRTETWPCKGKRAGVHPKGSIVVIGMIRMH